MPSANPPRETPGGMIREFKRGSSVIREAARMAADKSAPEARRHQFRTAYRRKIATVNSGFSKLKRSLKFAALTAGRAQSSTKAASAGFGGSARHESLRS
jgi:hypothetical protein